MVDTIKTKVDILNDLADNSTQDVSAQRLRNMLVSYLVFGELGMIDNTTEQTSLPAGFNVVPLDTVGPIQGVTSGTNLLKVDVDGKYRVSYEASYKGTGNIRYTHTILKNSATFSRTERRDTPTVTDEERNVSGSSTIDLLSTDEIKLGIRSQPALNNYTFISGGIRIERID